jgi:hypothetical protein
MLFGDRSALRKILTEEGAVILSAGQVDMLRSDLKSGDTNRLVKWSSYFDQPFLTYSHNDGTGMGLKETFQVYNIKEKPARSNLFNSMVFQLKTEQEKKLYRSYNS